MVAFGGLLGVAALGGGMVAFGGLLGVAALGGGMVAFGGLLGVAALGGGAVALGELLRVAAFGGGAAAFGGLSGVAAFGGGGAGVALPGADCANARAAWSAAKANTSTIHLALAPRPSRPIMFLKRSAIVRPFAAATLAAESRQCESSAWGCEVPAANVPEPTRVSRR
jgi:hypothetical protein